VSFKITFISVLGICLLVLYYQHLTLMKCGPGEVKQSSLR